MNQNQTMTTFSYNADEIFEEIPDDNENVIMKLPPEICTAMGWEPGDNLKINVEESGLVIQKYE